MNLNRTAEMIAMLCAKIAHIEPVIPAFGTMCRYDVVHAMALVKSLPAQLLLRIKYAEEDQYSNEFEHELLSAIERGALAHVVDFAAPQRWKIPRPGFLRDMCRLALVEFLSPKLCWRCEGRGGWLNRKGLKVVCPKCAGSGEGRHSDRSRAKILGIHEASWRQSWRDRYREIQTLIDRFEEIGLGGVTKRLR